MHLLNFHWSLIVVSVFFPLSAKIKAHQWHPILNLQWLNMKSALKFAASALLGLHSSGFRCIFAVFLLTYYLFVRPGIDVKRKDLFCSPTSNFSQKKSAVRSGSPPLPAGLLMHVDVPLCTGMQPRSPNSSHKVKSMKLSKMSRYDAFGIKGPGSASGELAHAATPWDFNSTRKSMNEFCIVMLWSASLLNSKFAEDLVVPLWYKLFFIAFVMP